MKEVDISKLSWHFQSGVNLAFREMILGKKRRPRLVKIMYFPDKPDHLLENPFPGIPIDGRVYFDDNFTNSLIWQGASGAKEWARLCKPVWQRYPYVDMWETPNEPQPVQNWEFCLQLSLFLEAAYGEMKDAGVRWTVGGNMSEGGPHSHEDKERRNLMCRIAPGLLKHDYLGWHGYFWPPEMDEWHLLTYRRNLRYMRDAGFLVKQKSILTETFIDGGVAGRPQKGWKTACNGNMDEGLEWAKRLDAVLMEDKEIEAGVVFTSMPSGWGDFDFDEEFSRKLIAYQDGLGNIPATGGVSDWTLWDEIQTKAWDMIEPENKIDAPAGFALPKKALSLGLGMALTPEFNIRDHVCQGFGPGVEKGAIVYTKRGEWEQSKIKKIGWRK
jgi:hypothetical protein